MYTQQAMYEQRYEYVPHLHMMFPQSTILQFNTFIFYVFVRPRLSLKWLNATCLCVYVTRSSRSGLLGRPMLYCIEAASPTAIQILLLCMNMMLMNCVMKNDRKNTAQDEGEIRYSNKPILVNDRRA